FQAPALYGLPLVIAANLVDWLPFLGNKLAKDARMHSLRDLTLIEQPTLLPIPQSYKNQNGNSGKELITLDSESRSKSPFYSFWDYHLAYQEQKTTPTKVAQLLVEALEEGNDKHHWMRSFDAKSVLEQAEASTERYKQGNPISQLDGVLVTIKEEMDVQGHETKGGSAFINVGTPAEHDATVPQRLREAGAIIVGHTVMNELGWDTFTVNPNTGTPRNPYDLVSSCGGSSGGSSASVASGLVPISIGADAGGSIRIPSSFCGLYGLKTTFGRLSSAGGLPLSQTLDVYGPITATADDLALTYSIVAGPDDRDPNTFYQPAVTLKDYGLTENLEGLTIATVPEWEAKVVEPEILKRIHVFRDHFEKLGAKIVEVDLPDVDLVGTGKCNVVFLILSRLNNGLSAHTITICSEMCNFAHQFSPKSSAYLPHTRLMMAIADTITSQDYYKAQQVRTHVMERLRQYFQNDKIDLFLLPTTAIQAPEIPKKAIAHGMSDTVTTINAMVYATLGNFTGVPAVSVPAGFHNGKPIGMQLIGEWWNEALLLRMAKVCEQTPGIERKHPEKQWYGGILEKALKE
ncbi:amidase signature domain-containing protein, partial [Fennellomyces sp. T-0311]